MNALETTLKQLRLSGLSQTLDVRLQEAAANRLSHAEFLKKMNDWVENGAACPE